MFRFTRIRQLIFRLSLLAASVPLLSWSQGTYNTSFPLTENPMSEGGRWINGKAVGLDWTDVRTTSNFAFGTMPGTASGGAQYADSTAVLSGSWGANQTVQATVAVVSASSSSSVFEEVELRLRTTITAHSIKGYEVNCSVNPASPYMQVVKWNGPLASWTQLDGRTQVCVNGDVIKATITGTSSTVITVYRNGSQVFSVTDSSQPFTAGSPGIGFFIQGATGLDANYGLKAFTATDGSTPPPSSGGACDLNTDGTTNVVDGQLAINMTLGLTPCTANIAGAGICNSTVVQRVMNAALGSACVTDTGTSPPASHSVSLTWSPSSSSSLTGYNVYRSTSSGGTYSRVNSTLVPSTSYTDSAVQAGQTYFYVATAVDTSNNESAYSNQAQAIVPSP